MENDKAIEQLLTQVASINEHYEEIAKISGENFNIFNILDLTSKELIHSKFIAMLLDPKGEHGMGDLFFKLFIKTIGINKCDKIDYSDVRVEIEKSIEEGRIDILITTRNKNIIIEDKIYAGDQKEQLLRYHDYCKDAVLLYLTLDGHNPSETSTNGLLKKEDDYYCISYRDHILNWLELCVKETANNPFLRETISQYNLLIKQLTGQARSKQMSDEVLGLITKSEENFTAYLTLCEFKKETIFRHVLNNTIIPALEKVAERHGLLFDITDDKNNILAEEYGFRFTKQPEWGNVYIWFAFGNNLNDLICNIFNYEKDANGKCKGWLEEEWNSMGEYKNWHWNNIEMLRKLCCQTDDVIQKIESEIKELMPKVKALLKQI